MNRRGAGYGDLRRGARGVAAATVIPDLTVADIGTPVTEVSNAGSESSPISVDLPATSGGETVWLFLVVADRSGADTGDILTPTNFSERFTDQTAGSGKARLYVYSGTAPGGGFGGSEDITFDDGTYDISWASLAVVVTNGSATEDVISTAFAFTSDELVWFGATATNTGGLTFRIAALLGDAESSQPSLSSHTAIGWVEFAAAASHSGATLLVYAQAQPSTTIDGVSVFDPITLTGYVTTSVVVPKV